jgi:uncharacterized protein with PIN domain
MSLEMSNFPDHNLSLQFHESVAEEAQEEARLAYKRYVRGRDSNPPALNLGRLQKDASYFAAKARSLLWECLP